MFSSGAPRQREFKASFASRRERLDRIRHDALQRQNDRREMLLEMTRKIIAETNTTSSSQNGSGSNSRNESGGGASSSNTTRKSRGKRRERKENYRSKKDREIWASRLMLPMWLTDVPDDLATNWVVRPRPEGQRCLLFTSQGETISRDRHGKHLHTFQSPLPDGSYATRGRGNKTCFLDCVFNQAKQTYYVLDIMSWNGLLLFDSTIEARLFWVNSKLTEIGADKTLPNQRSFRLLPMPFCEANEEGIRQCYLYGAVSEGI